MAASASPTVAGRSIDILGVPLDLMTIEEAHIWLRAALAEPWDGRCRHVVTLNPEYVMAAQRDPVFADAIRFADLVTADGVGVVVAAKMIHGRTVERLTGVDLVEWLATACGELNAPIFLLGAAPGVADAAASRLRERYPDLPTAGTWAGGSPSPDHDDESIERIEASGARVVAVAYGAPGQILWIERNQQRLAERGVRMVIGVGGSLDYLSGTVLRPPVIVRRLGLEWLIRLLREPWRWRRQRILPVFAARVLVATVPGKIKPRRDRTWH